MQITASAFGRVTDRLPEAIWFSFTPNTPQEYRASRVDAD
jgi:hypothetical protein